MVARNNNNNGEGGGPREGGQVSEKQSTQSAGNLLLLVRAAFAAGVPPRSLCVWQNVCVSPPSPSFSFSSPLVPTRLSPAQFIGPSLLLKFSSSLSLSLSLSHSLAHTLPPPISAAQAVTVSGGRAVVTSAQDEDEEEGSDRGADRWKDNWLLRHS
eukprot:TRINITY_DN2129_c0_g2_i4.p1 TRINITY_DN2129_c0_g2~~TRINITY_DN2129_c0_g2_i4.p1  ORF type:complete len:156 (-),score=18.48 TRINITY_DN2129_c0_g2_i4:109-576(-)